MSRLADSVFDDSRERRGPASSPTSPRAIPTSRERPTSCVALSDAGADVIEVGVPFSDPLADGPVIQRAVERAFAGGTTLRRTPRR